MNEVSEESDWGEKTLCSVLWAETISGSETRDFNTRSQGGQGDSEGGLSLVPLQPSTLQPGFCFLFWAKQSRDMMMAYLHA